MGPTKLMGPRSGDGAQTTGDGTRAPAAALANSSVESATGPNGLVADTLHYCSSI